MQDKCVGLDKEVRLPEPASTFAPITQARIGDEQIRKAWNELAKKWASRYTEHGDLNREHVIDPALLRLAGRVEGLSILDAGCGNGYLSRLLRRKGAKMAGVDLSNKFVEMAEQREKETPLGIEYHAASLCDLSVFQDQTFDMIVSNIVLMDVSDLNKAMEELHRVLKRNGRLIFSIMHPCFSSPPIRGWERRPPDSQRKEDWLYWKVDRYFDRSVETWSFYNWPATYSFHRPLSYYMKLLIEKGFVITDMEEPIPSRNAMKEHYRELGNECDRIPWFLIIASKKE